MLNRVVLMGRLVSDPELKTTHSGVNVTNFRIAVDRSFVKQGEERQADFFDIVAWRNTAEFVCKHFRKGSLIALDGTLQSRNYEANDGSKKYVVEVQAESVSFTGERKKENTESSYQPTYNNAAQVNSEPIQPAFVPTTGTQQEFVEVDVDDDLPF